MGGGKEKEKETRSIGLLDIDAIAVSNIGDDELDPTEVGLHQDDNNNKNGGLGNTHDEELYCFFSITSKAGEVFLFEALSSEESNRIVTGIKNMAFRLSSRVIAGDSHAVADFFDNTGEPAGTHLSRKEAMVRISHAFLDEVL
jgi:hypothetical protein